MDECKPLMLGMSDELDLMIANEVRRCRLTLSNPRSKRLEVSS